MVIFRNKNILKIIKYYRKIWALSHVYSLSEWDSEVYMPKNGYTDRGLALGYIQKLKQKFYTNKRFIDLIKKAEHDDLNDFEKGITRVLKRDIEYYEKIPTDLIIEFEKTKVASNKAWEEAKNKDNYDIFKPYLEKIIDLNIKIAEKLDDSKHPYDVLLDLYEEGLNRRDVDKIFSIIDDLKTILRKITSKGEFPNHHSLENEEYDKGKMKTLNEYILKSIGYDFNKGRLDVSAHPFTIEIGPNDVRITTWYHNTDFRRSLLAAIHEFGHALYELQIMRELHYTPIGKGVSLGIHESQSRFWENIIGRSLEFVEVFLEVFREHLQFLEKYDAIEVFKYFNIVRPDLIRVEADEVTYNFHIFIRYYIEKEMIEGNINVEELPDLWADLYEKYLGVRPSGYKDGVLQDVHWSLGMIGYFPTYTLGTILSAQIFYEIDKDLDLKQSIINSDFNKIREWLKDKIHRYGATYSPKELLNKSLKTDYNPEQFIKYIKSKYLKE